MNPSRLCLALLIVSLPVRISAQSGSAGENKGSPAVRVMATLRATGEGGDALFVLRGFRTNATRAEQDELADSLAAFVIGWREGDEWKKLEAAFGTLSLSSRAEGYGAAYVGASQRLRRIAESGVSHSLGGAINALASLPDRTEALSLTEGLARFPGPAAALAVQRLEVAFGTAGLETLRRLHVEGDAGTADARVIVAGIARRRAW